MRFLKIRKKFVELFLRVARYCYKTGGLFLSVLISSCKDSTCARNLNIQQVKTNKYKFAKLK
jgi:hypothetical protein